MIDRSIYDQDAPYKVARSWSLSTLDLCFRRKREIGVEIEGEMSGKDQKKATTALEEKLELLRDVTKSSAVCNLT